MIFILLIWNIALTVNVTNGDGSNDDFECYCVEQMRNIIEQIVTLYPNNQLFITLDSGDAVIGTPGDIRLGPNGKSGIFEVEITQGDTTQLLSICSIDSITVNNAVYNEQITYLPEPMPMPTDCRADCDSAIRRALPIGTQGVSIITNTQISSQGNVIQNEPGIVVLDNPQRDNITFVSSCGIDVVYLQD